MSRTDRLLDAALDTYPMAPLPEGFVDGAMAQIGAPKRKQFGILDLAAAAAVVGIASTAALTWWSLEQVDSLWLERLQLEILRTWIATSDADVVAAVLALAGSIVLVLVLLPAVLLITERRRVTAA